MSKRLEAIDAMIRKGIEDPFVWYARAMELRSLERLSEALAAYDEVRDRFPDYVPTYLMAGQVCEETGDIEGARVWLEAGISVASKAGDAHALSELQAMLSTLA